MQVVLVEPQIPQNTGSIARTCAATYTPLHIVGKTPFEISERTVRRAGLDYWPFVDLQLHATWEEYSARSPSRRVWLFSKFATRCYYEADFFAEDALVFGSETKGLGKEFMSHFPPDQALRIPIDCDGVRSLNLSNAVSIALYEARRQIAQRPIRS
ncbi:MAG: tRNA (cytidine(34)-2'-O)-methyltransferase [Oligoflexia bacterium]|nr:tRNA (cytidine(34)-2'-O)-methyltransferase [Oligoflexia bacterium]